MNTTSVKAVEGLSILRVVVEIIGIATICVAIFGLSWMGEDPLVIVATICGTIILGGICYIDYQAYKVAAFVLENWEDE